MGTLSLLRGARATERARSWRVNSSPAGYALLGAVPAGAPAPALGPAFGWGPAPALGLSSPSAEGWDSPISSPPPAFGGLLVRWAFSCPLRRRVSAALRR
eukprot:1546464-Pyramimonas_sp.AAC.1